MRAVLTLTLILTALEAIAEQQVSQRAAAPARGVSPSSSPGRMLNIVFAHDPGQGHYDGAVGSPRDVWNFVDIGTTAKDYLRWNDGTGSPATLRVAQHDGEWGIEDQAGIFHGYIYHNCQCVDLWMNVRGLPRGRYGVYVYAHGDAPDQNAEIEVAVAEESYGRKATLHDGSWDFRSTKWREGVQFVSFEILVDDGQEVTITSHRAGSSYSMFNAIQFVQLHEARR